ncbi:MAG: 50S ribosomal protein L13, partial [Cyanobacteria bacterium J06636_28]
IPLTAFSTMRSGMLPKNALGRKLFTNLKVYAGPEHPHDAQKPEAINL